MKFFLFIILIFSLNSCYYFVYKINIEDINDLRFTIIETENFIKKIVVIPTYKGNNYNYPLFRLTDNNVMMMYTMVNYDSNDSIREGRKNPNIQENIDTCKVMPGLSLKEWEALKLNLRKLENFGIRKSNVAYYNDAKFQFFYYNYFYPENWEYRDIGYLALLSDEIVNTKEFKQRFKVMDKKDEIYLIKLIR